MTLEPSIFLSIFIKLIKICFLYFFQVKLLRLDPESDLYKDMEEMSIPHILLSLSFPENFPFQPPFLRVLSPRLEKVSFLLKFHDLILHLLFDIWSPPRLSELTPMIFNIRLTHLSSEASIYSM